MHDNNDISPFWRLRDLGIKQVEFVSILRSRGYKVSYGYVNRACNHWEAIGPKARKIIETTLSELEEKRRNE